jgi:integrase
VSKIRSPIDVVPFPTFLMLGLRLARAGKSPDDLVFRKRTGHHRLPQSQDGWFAAAVKRARREDPNFPKISPHDLRHTAASLAISAGANVKAVQRMLGHASASMTLDTYADLFDDDLTGSQTPSIRLARIQLLPKCCHGTIPSIEEAPRSQCFQGFAGLRRWR